MHPNGQAVGITINSLTSVSLDPPLLLWCLRHGSCATAAFCPGRDLAISILREDQAALARACARRASLERPEVDWVISKSGVPRIENVLCRFECRVDSLTSAGDHRIILCRVLRFEAAAGEPLIFYGGEFGQLAKQRACG
jgi:flavin reductase (DIM6/NTAB) family NADH-FMN oxidoreductase RutF